MNFLRILGFGMKEIFANKIRSALTMLGVIIGVGAIILLFSIEQGAKIYVASQIKEVGKELVFVLPGKIEFGKEVPSALNRLVQGTAENKLTLKEVRALEKTTPPLGEVAAILESKAKIKFGSKTKTMVVKGVTAAYPQVLKAPLNQGKFIQDFQVQGGRRVAVLSKTTANDLFEARDPLGQRIAIAGQKFTVIGVTAEKRKTRSLDQDNKVVYIPITAAQTLFGVEKLSQIIVKVKGPPGIEETMSKIKKILGKRLDENDFSVGTQVEMLGGFKDFLNPLTIMLAGMAGISFLLGGISITNLVLALVAEQVREIGIRKMVGARPFHIFTQFLLEAVVLGVVGGAVGVLLGVTFSIWLNRFLPSQITIWSIPAALGFSTALGFFFGIFPAFKASRLNPAEALRYQ